VWSEWQQDAETSKQKESNAAKGKRAGETPAVRTAKNERAREPRINGER
jgi:hypothetical protein